MTDRFYGADLGADLPTDVTEAASTTSKIVELRVAYDTTGLDRLKVVNALEAIKNYIIQDNWPPV